MPTHFSIEKLRSDHAVDGFDCGNEELNRFLVRYALTNQLASSSQTYIGLADISIVGFYTLTVSQVDFDTSPQRLTKGLAHHPLQCLLRSLRNSKEIVNHN